MKKFFTKIKNWFVDHKPSKRRIIQLYTALLYNANIKGFFNGQIYKGPTKNLCVPGINCYSCPGAVGSCPLGALQNALSASDTRLPAYIFGIVILFGLLLGRTICGFLCPIGLGQDLLYKIKTPKLKKNKVTYALSYLKYVLLIALVVIVPLVFAVPGFCEFICPAGTFEGGFGLLSNQANEGLLAILGPLFTWKFTVLVLVAVGGIFIFRIFCRFLCPLGALYGFFCRIAMLGVKLDKNKCTDCGLCISVCKMDIKRVGDHECIHCGACISVCPTKAITWKGSQLFVRENNVDMPADTEIKPIASMLKPKTETSAKVEKMATAEVENENE
ncbi:MAG: 4Fe-4S binding protein [Clostridiales bacterium]|nr:4Fe-4S binding protein [Clostridiales bacterium]